MLRPALLLLATLSLAACGAKDAPTTKPAARACLAPPPAGRATPQAGGMVLVKGGRFEMGARPMHAEEGPPRGTRVGDFWIDRTEVTNAQFAAFVTATGYVTEAETPLDPKAYPGLTGDQLKPSG